MKPENKKHVSRLVAGFAVISVILTIIAMIMAAFKNILAVLLWTPFFYLAGYIYELYKKRDSL